jgi:NAD(P)-dependent dehydrogenase (short-subunit alcohol dehydrogenase family)
MIMSLGPKAVAVAADLTCPEGIETLFAQASLFSPPSILINSAAVFTRRPLGDIEQKYAQDMLNANLIAPILVSRSFVGSLDIPAEIDEPIAKIVNLTDVGAIKPWGEYAIYCASKAGLVAVTKSLAKELAPAVCVNSVAPGTVTLPDDFSEEEKQKQLAMIPSGKMGKLSDIADAVVFLLKNDYITGQTLTVDGGRTL